MPCLREQQRRSAGKLILHNNLPMSLMSDSTPMPGRSQLRCLTQQVAQAPAVDRRSLLQIALATAALLQTPASAQAAAQGATSEVIPVSNAAGSAVLPFYVVTLITASDIWLR